MATVPYPDFNFLVVWDLARRRAGNTTWYNVLKNEMQADAIAYCEVSAPSLIGGPINAILLAYLLNEWNNPAGQGMPNGFNFAMVTP